MDIFKIRLANYNSNTFHMLMHLLLLFVFRYKMSPVTIDNPLYCHTGGLINQRYVIFMHIYLQLLITNVAYLEKIKTS